MALCGGQPAFVPLCVWILSLVVVECSGSLCLLFVCLFVCLCICLCLFVCLFVFLCFAPVTGLAFDLLAFDLW